MESISLLFNLICSITLLKLDLHVAIHLHASQGKYKELFIKIKKQWFTTFFKF